VGSAKANKRVRFSVFLEQFLIDEVKDYRDSNGGHMADIIRTALFMGLNQMKHSNEMLKLKSGAIEAAAAKRFDEALEAIDRMAARVGRPSAERLMEQINEAVANRDFATARNSLYYLELQTESKSGSSLGVEGMDEALENEDFDGARKILGQLKANARAKERAGA
jgi:thioredoxin-like negative regulator of GroEL